MIKRSVSGHFTIHRQGDTMQAKTYGLKPHIILMALFNGASHHRFAKAIGLKKPYMTEREALEYLAMQYVPGRRNSSRFDYVDHNGVPVLIKTYIPPIGESTGVINAQNYDREHGAGAAQRALDEEAQRRGLILTTGSVTTKTAT
jgi:hypothetical protein